MSVAPTGLLLERDSGRRKQDSKAFVQVPIDSSLFKPIMWVVLIVVVLVAALAVTNHFGAFYSSIIQDEISHLQGEAREAYRESDARRDMRHLRINLEAQVGELRLLVLAQGERIESLERELDLTLGIGTTGEEDVEVQQ